MPIWFTSDTHFGHANIIEYSNRPFASVQSMDEALINNWNQLVSPQDTIYHLGDFTLRGQAEASDYFSQLNGKIIVVPGGHDWRWQKANDYTSKSGYPVIILPALHSIKVTVPEIEKVQPIVLCHYAMRVWDKSHYGSWHLYGHSHGQLPPLKNSLDVGVDCWNFQPIPVETIFHAITQSRVY